MSFRELDDLVLDLKGLVLVRKLRERNGAEAGELAMYGAEIERVRERLARYGLPHPSLSVRSTDGAGQPRHAGQR
jgi:hypothetical protein